MTAPSAVAAKDRVLRIEVQGTGRMLRAWLRRREVFRAAARLSKQGNKGRSLFTSEHTDAILFAPFLTAYERGQFIRKDQAGKRHRHTSAPIPIEQWVHSFTRDGSPRAMDALDLRLHECVWHVIDKGVDAPELRGLASNDAATRAATTKPKDRWKAVERLAAHYDLVVLYRMD